MQVTITETTNQHSPSSPFRHSVTLGLETKLNPETTYVYTKRDELCAEACEWCRTQWGNAIDATAVRQGNFSDHYEWYRSGVRYWFRTSEQLFAFKLRWQGYELDR